MRKLVLILGALLMMSNSFAGSTSLDAKSLSKSILNAHKLTGAEKGSFEIVYGGQDISRGSIGAAMPSVDSPVLVG